MAALPFLSYWLPHLLSSSRKEHIQSEQPLRPSWLITFMSPSSLASVKRYAKGVAFVPKTILRKGQEQSIGGTPLESLIMDFTKLQ
jgi:hypothetical protein